MISQYTVLVIFFLQVFYFKAPRPLELWMMDRQFPSVKEVSDSTGHFTYPVAKKTIRKEIHTPRRLEGGQFFRRAAMGIVRKGLITIRRTSIPISLELTDVKQCDEFQ